MRASVVAIAAQAGASGPVIAQQLALKLGRQYYDWEIVSRAALLAGVSQKAITEGERWPSLAERFMRVVSLSAIESRSFMRDDPYDEVAEEAVSYYYHVYVEQVVRDLAKQGDCVIFGHAATAILDSGAAFKVLLHSPLLSRAEALARQDGVDLLTAVEAAGKADEQQASYMKHVYKADLLDVRCYDLALNTDGLSSDQAAELIARAAGTPSRAATH